jgi:N6-adenosine-specific RNA methylase IME4
VSAAPKADNLPWPPITGKKYGLLSLDPAWHHETRAPVQNPEISRTPQRHYPTTDLDYLETLPIRDLADTDCHVMMWITGALMAKGAHTRLFKAWGVRPSSIAFVWIKLWNSFDTDQLLRTPLLENDISFGMGLTTRQAAEFCVLGRIGSPKRARADIRQVIVSPRREHSRKPEEYFRRAFYYSNTPRLDMFGGKPREGWDSWVWNHREGEGNYGQAVTA